MSHSNLTTPTSAATAQCPYTAKTLDDRKSVQLNNDDKRQWYDTAFALFFILAFVIAWTIEIIPAFGPVDGAITTEWAAKLRWPPGFVKEWFFQYGEAVDPLFVYNPVWMKVLSLTSPLVFSWFYLAAAYAFLLGRNWIRLPAIIWASSVMTTTSVLIACELMIEGFLAPRNVVKLMVALTPYLIIPLLVMARVMHAEPFGTPRGPSMFQQVRGSWNAMMHMAKLAVAV